MGIRKKSRGNAARIITSHIINNLRAYLSVIVVFLIGIVLGVVVINNSSAEQITQINDYINNFISDLKEYGDIDKTTLLAETFFNNLYLILVLWFVGSTVIGIPIVYGMIAYEGFCLSYTISSSIITLGTWNGTVFSLASMFLQNIIYIPCMMALAVSGIKLYKSILKDKRRENIKFEIIRHIMFSALIGSIMLLGTLVETYISTNLIISFINIL